jgi:hypothetical protein
MVRMMVLRTQRVECFAKIATIALHWRPGRWVYYRDPNCEGLIVSAGTLPRIADKFIGSDDLFAIISRLPPNQAATALLRLDCRLRQVNFL